MPLIDTSDVEYWTEGLVKHAEEMDADFLKQLYAIPMPEFTYEDMYKLRELMMNIHVKINLLDGATTKLVAQNKKPLWKLLRGK